jgi:hypothetical protein
VATKRTTDREVLGVVLLLMLGYANSDKVVGGALTAIGRADSPVWRVSVLLVDIAILAVVAKLKRAMARADGTPGRLWGWWWAGFIVVCLFDIVRLVLGDGATLGVDLLTSVAFLVAMAILMLSSLNADPLTLFSSRRREALPSDWMRVSATAPLIIGSLAAFLGATLWTEYFNPTAVRTLDPEVLREIAQMSLVDQQTVLSQLCDEGINPNYFQHIAEVVPVLLLALGVEFNYFHKSLSGPVTRAAMVVTVTLMCTALVLALSTLPFDGNGCDDVLAPWHEYLAFTISLQAVFMALATVVWMLVVNMSEAVKADEQTQ